MLETGNNLCGLWWKSFFFLSCLNNCTYLFYWPPKVPPKVSFGNQELIKLNVVAHNFLAMKEEGGKSLRLMASLFLRWNQKSSNSAFGEWSPQAIYLPTVGKHSLSWWKFLFISLWLWTVKQSQVWVQRTYRFNRLGLDATISWLEKSIKQAFRRLACHWAEIRVASSEGRPKNHLFILWMNG